MQSETTQHEVVLISPEDGGYPRPGSGIEKILANHYRINLSDAGKSCILVEAINSSSTTKELVIEFDPDPRTAYTEYLNKSWSRSKSHFYYRTPSGKWFRKHLEDGAPRLVIQAENGMTRISGVPFYTYSEYISYVESLNDPRVTKEVAFSYENGLFKVYRIKVTNPGGVKNKMKIGFGRWMHVQETSGYYMTQGIIEWLLSGDPAANLDNIEWSFYPVPDPIAIYYRYGADELEFALYENGKTAMEYFFDRLKGLYHIVQLEHMWGNEHGGIFSYGNLEVLDTESYEYYDPFSKESTEKIIYPEVVPASPFWRDYISFWPHWFEYGTDTYYHRDARHWDKLLPGTMLMLNEIIFYGKDSGGDLIANIKEQGKQWALATSQVYMHFQQKYNYWTESHPIGPVDITGAVILPKPEHTLLEDLEPVSGNIIKKGNGYGEPMYIFKKKYDHGLGMKTGESVTYTIPEGVNSFKANTAIDDSEPDASACVECVVKFNDREIWRSPVIKKFESQMAHIKLPGSGNLTLSAEGPKGTLVNWGGARFTVNDPQFAYKEEFICR